MKKINMYLFAADTSKNDLINDTGVLGILDNALLYAKDEKTADGNFVLDLELNSNDEVVNLIKGKSIIKARRKGNWEYFVVCSIVPTLNEVRVTARQWTIEATLNQFLVDVRPTTQNGQGYLNWITTRTEEYKDNKQYAKDLEVYSNISSVNSSNLQNKNLYECIATAREVFSAEIDRESFKVSLNNRVGSEVASYQVMYGKNIIEFEQDQNFDLATRIIGVGFDGIQGDIIKSEIEKTNPNIQGRTVTFNYPVRIKGENSDIEDKSYIWVEDETEARKLLNDLARKEFSNNIDKPLIDYRTKFLTLSRILEYKGTNQKLINLGDVVNVVVKSLNINIDVRVYGEVFDYLTQEVDEVYLSNADIKSLKPPTLNEALNKIENMPKEILEEAKKQTIDTINNGIKDSYVVVRKNLIAIGDAPDVNLMKNCWIFNRNGFMFSKNGAYNTDPNSVTVACDMEGNFNASIINTGVLNANLVKTGILSAILIQSLDGGLSIDLSDSGEGVQFKTNNMKAINIKKQSIRWYDWETNSLRSTPVGNIYSARMNGSNTTCGLSIAHRENAYLAFSFYDQDKSNYYAYMKLDNENVCGDGVGIRMYVPLLTNTIESSGYIKTNSYVKALGLQDKDSTSNYLLADTENSRFIASKSFLVGKDLVVSGNKNCVQKTKSYGNRKFYSKESAISILTFDEVEEKEVVENNQLLIPINKIFKEAVNLELGYRLIIDRVKGDYNEVVKTDNYFIIKANNGFKFTYSIEAKRLGYEKEFMNEVSLSDMKKIEDEVSYDNRLVF